jgi:uncharacterized repeat protein (TIGR03803 family)
MNDLNHSRNLPVRPRSGSILGTFVPPVLMAGLGLMMPAGGVTAQTFTTLHSFKTYNSSTNTDGAGPRGSLILSGNTLYGAAATGGSGGSGTVFAVNTDGTGYAVVKNFSATAFNPSIGTPTNSDGASPNGGLVLSGNTLYGMANGGGNFGQGTVFAVNTDGNGFTNLHNFTGFTDGGYPYGGLVLSGNTLYGTADGGGDFFQGAVFAVRTDGTGFTNLHSFAGGTNGANPRAGLVLSGNTLYGTACDCEQSGPDTGTVFALGTDGSRFTNIYKFTATADNGNGFNTNNDGASPYGVLVLSGNRLYGTANGGGSGGGGTVFAVNTNGTGFTNLHNFINLPSDGFYPFAGLVLSRNTLYGTTDSGYGTVFAVNTDGTGFTNLHNFTAPSSSIPNTNSDGTDPYAGLVLSGYSLYGAASGGGNFGVGTVFSLSLQPQLTITPAGTNVVLSWPTNVAGFDYTGYTLQSATSVGSPVWITNLPAPVVVNGQNTVTNLISGTRRFYRLSE